MAQDGVASPRRPKMLLDVPDVVMLLVFDRLGFKDRIALAQTCRQLRDLAYSEGVFSHEKHVISSPQSAITALVHRAKHVGIRTEEGMEVFLYGYCLLVGAKWPIRRFELHSGVNNAWLRNKMGMLIPSISSLHLDVTQTEGEVHMDSPTLFAGLNNCTELSIGGVADISLDVLAAVPNLRTLRMAPGVLLPSSITGGPALRNLVSLELDLVYALNPTQMLRELQPHLPVLESLELWDMQCEVVPPAVFDITTLRSLAMIGCDAQQIPEAIRKLTRLTKLKLREGEGAISLRNVSPAIGTLSGLQSLTIGLSDSLEALPREIMHLTGLTELRLGTGNWDLCAGLDLRVLRGLKVLWLADTSTDIRNVISTEHDLAQLEELAFGDFETSEDTVPLYPALFRPQLRRLDMQAVRGPFPSGFAQRACNLTELSMHGGYVCANGQTCWAVLLRLLTKCCHTADVLLVMPLLSLYVRVSCARFSSPPTLRAHTSTSTPTPSHLPRDSRTNAPTNTESSRNCRTSSATSSPWSCCG